MLLIVSPLLVPISESDRIRSSMLASFGSSVSAWARRRSRISFSCLNCARLLAIDCFWMSSSSSACSVPWRCVIWVCIGSMKKYQFAAERRMTTPATTPTFWPRGILLTALSTSCPVSAISFASGRVVRVAGDDPLHGPVCPLPRRLDGDVAEVGRGLQLLGEVGEVLVAGGRAVHRHGAALLVEVHDPDLLRDDGGHLVEHFHRPGAPLLQGVEDLQLVLERLLVFLDRLHLADGLLQLGDLVASGDDLLVEREQLRLEAVVDEEVPDPRQDQEQHEEHQLLPAELALLGCADREEVDEDHRARSPTARSTCAAQARWRPPPTGRRPSRSWSRNVGCRSPRP